MEALRKFLLWIPYPKRTFSKLWFGTGGAFLFFYILSETASVKTIVHEKVHILQQWLCFGAAYAVGLHLALAMFSWYLIYGAEIAARFFVFKFITHRHWGWKKALYVAYKRCWHERMARWVAGQAEKDWAFHFDGRYV